MFFIKNNRDEAEMIEERRALFFGERVFSKRVERRVIIINNRLERQKKNLQKKHRNEGKRHVYPPQTRLLEFCEKQKR